MESEPDEDSQDAPTSVNVIRVEFDEGYEGTAVVSPQPENSSVIKGKYYKQTYRTAWETMPDFKGWLRGVQGEPTRAYCLYCQKTLHAHRLSLLKHTCTIRHQKAAQIHNIRKNKGMTNAEDPILLAPVVENDEAQDDEGEPTMEYADVDEDAEHDTEQGEEEQEPEEEEEGVQLETLPVQFQKQFRQQISSPVMLTRPPISTHVLDTAKGVAACGLQVSLYKLIDGRWTYINEGMTNSDGRFSNFLHRANFTAGRYKLHYDVDRFFEARKQDTLYPFIEIVFDCKAPTDYYHVPLLLSPYGYTTYKGT